MTIDEFDTPSGTSFGHSAALGGLGVGAADYRDTPVFGQSPPLIEGFSSAGGTPILFDTAGNRLVTAEVRAQPWQRRPCLPSARTAVLAVLHTSHESTHVAAAGRNGALTRRSSSGRVG